MNKDKKGFTLIELLAVIVVLAIVMVLAATTVLPYMANARKKAFITEVQALKKAADNALDLINVGQIKDNYVKSGDYYCFTVDNLKNLGLYSKDDASYIGKVEIEKNNSSFKYKISLRSDDYIIKNSDGKIEDDDVLNRTEENDENFSCNIAYAIYTEDNKTLTFVRSETSIGDTYNGKTVTNVYTGFEDKIFEMTGLGPDVPWQDIKSSITNVKFEGEIKPIDTKGWFMFFGDNVTVDVTNLDTSLVTDMSNMFMGTKFQSLTGLNSLNTSNVTNMSGMFSFATINNDINISGWDTSNVTNMEAMFDAVIIGNDVVIDLSNWDISEDTNLNFFASNENITSGKIVIPQSGEVKAYAVYTSHNNTLTFLKSSITPELSGEFVPGTITNVFTDFEDKIWTMTSTGADVPWKDISFNITKIVFEDNIKPKDTKGWFQYLGDNAIVDVTNLDTSLVTDMSNMFMDTKFQSLTGLNSLNTSNVTNMSGMFSYATINNDINISEWDTRNVTNLSSMFMGATINNVMNISFNVSNVKDMSYMFHMATINKDMGISSWGDGVSNVTNMDGMFFDTETNVDIDLSSWNVSKVTNNSMFTYYAHGNGTITLPTAWQTT